MSKNEVEIEITGEDIKRFFRNYGKTIAIICSILAVISLVTFLFVRFFELPIKEGTIKERLYDEEHVGYIEDSKSVTRTEFYVTTDSDGNIVTRSRQVFDHYEYCVVKHFDGEDFILFITSPSQKIKDKILTRYIYITKNIFESQEVGDYFVADFKQKGRNESTRDRNNYRERVTNWHRGHVVSAVMLEWKRKEY
jgi:hypothetical protein